MKITVMLFQSIKVTSLTASTHQSCWRVVLKARSISMP
jgi:hypothetical protein